MSILRKYQEAKAERAEAVELLKKQTANKIAVLSKGVSFPGENRELTREQYYRIAQITLADGEKLPCDVLNETKAGFKLTLESDAKLPKRFTLLVPSREVDQMVSLVWQDGLEFGISLK